MRFCQGMVLFIGIATGPGGSVTSLSYAIEIRSSPAQVQAAVDQGKEAAAQHWSPEMFYTCVGAADEVQAGGLLDAPLEVPVSSFPASGGEEGFIVDFAKIE